MSVRAARGEPLWALGSVLAIWVGLRVAFWAPDAAHAGLAMPVAGGWDLAANDPEALRLTHATEIVLAQQEMWSVAALQAGMPVAGPVAGPVVRRAVRGLTRPARGRVVPGLVAGGSGDVRATDVPVGVAAVGDGGWVRVGPPPRRQREAVRGPLVAVAWHDPAADTRRWSGDGWAMWRQGGIGFDHGAILPAYGASQAGAVLRWRVNPGHARAVDLYVRGSAALVVAPYAPSREGEVAAGVSVRPLGWVPVTLAVEARASRFDDGSTHLRPAVMAVSAMPPVALPLGLRGDVYAAAGYVGGAAATGFVDGQARVDHALARFGGFDLRAGAGVWGGAQQGAGRLDVGPAVSLGFRVGRTGARLEVDWRAKVAGDARPGSGPAVTLAAGF